MRSICLYFQVHQPFRLRTYRFFNIGDDHYYYDDYQNRTITRRVAEKCYLPANKMMLDLIKEYGTTFKISFAISGTAIEQFREFAPEVLKSFRKLADTGCVEFLAEPYSHSLASLANKGEFMRQTDLHRKAIKKHFGVEPVTFRNAELIYSDGIGEMVAEMGFQTMVTEGARHILGWKSPNYLYVNAVNPKLKLLLRNFRLSDDIAFRFSTQTWPEWPITAEKFAGWLNGISAKEEVVNLFIDYETIGERQWKETGIFDFFWALPKTVFERTNFRFTTPAEVSKVLQPVASIHVPYPLSWADEERDLTSWLGNELQDEAFQKVYAIAEAVKEIEDEDIQQDWHRLQTTDHFYYMCTKWFSDGTVHKYFNPYASPYEAFINYMNVLSDFYIRVEDAKKESKRIRKQAKPEKPAPKKLATRTGKLRDEGPVVISAKVIEAEKKALKRKVAASPVAKKIQVQEKDFKKLNFNSIITFSDKKVKDIIREMDIETLSKALKGEGKAVREKVEKNLGKRALNTYREVLTSIRTIHESEIEKSRKLFEKQIKSITKQEK